MPFSLWRNNDLWNLFPTAPGINSEKSDKLPTYRLLNHRRDAIIGCWRGLEGALGERFRREAQTLLGRDPFESNNWEGRLFSRFVEAVIANLPEFGSGSPGTEAIKRITQDADYWIYVSDNPDYSPFRVSKSDIGYPILGTMVGKV